MVVGCYPFFRVFYIFFFFGSLPVTGALSNTTPLQRQAAGARMGGCFSAEADAGEKEPLVGSAAPPPQKQAVATAQPTRIPSLATKAAPVAAGRASPPAAATSTRTVIFENRPSLVLDEEADAQQQQQGGQASGDPVAASAKVSRKTRSKSMTAKLCTCPLFVSWCFMFVSNADIMDYYINMMTYVSERNKRLQQVKLYMRSPKLSEEARQKEWDKYRSHERAALRQRRLKMSLQNFHAYCKIGEGGYGEVCFSYWALKIHQDGVGFLVQKD